MGKFARGIAKGLHAASNAPSVVATAKDKTLAHYQGFVADVKAEKDALEDEHEVLLAEEAS